MATEELDGNPEAYDPADDEEDDPDVEYDEDEPEVDIDPDDEPEKFQGDELRDEEVPEDFKEDPPEGGWAE